MQNLADVKSGFIKVIELDLRQINYWLVKMIQTNSSLKLLAKAQEYLDAGYRKVAVALNYFQAPGEEPDNYKRLNDRTKALQEARSALVKCNQQWPKQFRDQS